MPPVFRGQRVKHEREISDCAKQETEALFSYASLVLRFQKTFSTFETTEITEEYPSWVKLS